MRRKEIHDGHVLDSRRKPPLHLWPLGFAEFTDVYEIQSDFAAKVESEFNKMIETATTAQTIGKHEHAETSAKAKPKKSVETLTHEKRIGRTSLRPNTNLLCGRNRTVRSPRGLRTP